MFADALASVMKKIGGALPHFVDVVKIFSNNDRLKDLLALFYRDTRLLRHCLGIFQLAA
jgi:hypothetical protein